MLIRFVRVSLWLLFVTVSALPTLWVTNALGSHSGVHQWIGADGGSFYDKGNWLISGPPGQQSTALFQLKGGAYLVNFPHQENNDPADPVTSRLVIRSNQPTFQLFGRTYGLHGNGTGDNASLLVTPLNVSKQGEHGALTLLDGHLLGSTAVIGGRSALAPTNEGRLNIGAKAQASFDTVYIGFDGPAVVNISDGGILTADASLGATKGMMGTVNVTGQSSLADFANLKVGEFGPGEVHVTNHGAIASDDAVVGSVAEAPGKVTIAGAGSAWTSFGHIIVGNQGTGSVVVEDSGAITTKHLNLAAQPGSSGSIAVESGGTVSIDATGTLNVGERGTATISVAAGGSLTSGNAVIGHQAGAEGMVDVVGEDAQWQAASLTIGAQGKGGLLLGGAAEMHTAETVLLGEASSSSASVSIDGTGSKWTSAGPFHIGHAGAATVGVGGGSHLLAQGEVLLAATPGGTASAEASVSGAGSLWQIGGPLVIGRGGAEEATRTGKLTLGDGARIESAGTVIAASAHSAGDVTVLGAETTWLDSGSLFLGGTDSAAGGKATLRIEDGAAVEVADRVKIWNHAAVELNAGRLAGDEVELEAGSLTGEGAILGQLVNGGRLAPGNGVGILTVEGEYIQESVGKLEIELAGAAPGESDLLVVFGDAAFDGQLNVSLAGSFAPAIGDTFNILDFAAASGSFAKTNLPPLAEGRIWSVDALLTEGLLAVEPTLPADFNFDGKVDLADFTILKQNFGTTTTYENGDANSSGRVDLGDFVILRNNFGQTVGTTAAAVPEPGSGLLIIAGLAVLGIYRRRASRILGTSRRA